MIEFLKAGGPFMWLLVVTSLTALAFILERAWALRWNRVVPTVVENAVESCQDRRGVDTLRSVCTQHPSEASRLLLTAANHLDWPVAENVDALQTRARREVVGLERGLVILEVIVGIAPLLGLVGTVHGLISLFGDFGKASTGDNEVLAKGIAMALNTTLMGLLIAIPSLVAWSYFSKKVESLTVELETLCDEFVRRMYRRS